VPAYRGFGLAELLGLPNQDKHFSGEEFITSVVNILSKVEASTDHIIGRSTVKLKTTFTEEFAETGV
jgi:hypothetical protein